MGQFGYVGAFDPNAKVIWKTAGATDMLAILSLDLPDGHTAVCNACGEGESPVTPGALEWVKQFAGIPEVFVIHDCDVPGQSGAMWTTNPTTGRKRPGWAPAIASFAPCVKNVVPPYIVEPNHGKDVRDWIVERLEAGRDKASIYAELLEYARSQPIVEGVPGLAASEEEPGEDEDGEGTEVVFQGEASPAVDANGDPIWEGDDDPHRLARVNLDRYWNTHGGRLFFWRDEWWKYKAGQCQKIDDSNLRAKVTSAIRAEFEDRWREAEERRIAKEEATGEEQKRFPIQKVTTTLVRNVIAAMQSMAVVSAKVEMPCWLPDRSRPNLVSLQNGLLDLDAIFQNKPKEECLLPHSPNWFSLVKLPYEFDWDAQCPAWESFLEDVFSGDQESITALQMWFGYLLTQDTSLQKMMLVIGRPRSGKGTIMRTLAAMLGPDAVSSPTLGQLASQFELHGLVGKSVGIIGDARLSHRTDEVAVTERLLSITGEDPQDIQRKHLTTLHAVRLAIRFMLFSNQLPALNDSSAALISRCLLLVMPNSYVDREDRTLGKRILTELPGILIWAITGRKLLDVAGKIPQPSSGREMLKQFRSLVSPVSLFVEESCEVNDDHEIETSELFERWCEWCLLNDISQKMTIQNFSKSLRDVLPGLKVARPRIGSQRLRKFIGLSVRKNISHVEISNETAGGVGDVF